MPSHTPKEKAKNRKKAFKENRAQPFGKKKAKTKKQSSRRRQSR